jgi:predicted transcriptional regulator YdeE
MKTLHISEPMLVMGMALRTRNDRAFRDIPALWDRFRIERWLDRIPQRSDEHVYAVYTHHEHEGIDNHGDYTLILGAQVSGVATVPEGFASAVIPSGRYAVFDVDRGRPDKVGERWQDIWNHPGLQKTYRCDHERYAPDGSIEIRIGIR